MDSLCQNICTVDWLKAADVVNALGVVIVAIFVAFIQRRQATTARAKFKLDLFEKRFAVFVAVRRLLESMPGAMSEDLHEVDRCEAAVVGSSFLFGADIREYISDVIRRAQQMIALARKERILGERNSMLPVEDQQRQSELAYWFDQQITELEKRFLPYLEFRKWK